MAKVECLHEGCEYYAEHIGQLQVHIKSIHKLKEEKRFPCPYHIVITKQQEKTLFHCISNEYMKLKDQCFIVPMFTAILKQKIKGFFIIIQNLFMMVGLFHVQIVNSNQKQNTTSKNIK